MGEDYYEILGVSEIATKEELLKSLRKQVDKWHPDKSSCFRTKSNGILRKLVEAYDILKDDQKRKIYDKNIKKKNPKIELNAIKSPKSKLFSRLFNNANEAKNFAVFFDFLKEEERNLQKDNYPNKTILHKRKKSKESSKKSPIKPKVLKTDIIDMFDLSEEEIAISKNGEPNGIRRENDMCDDPEGFYTFRSGELLNDRYKVLGFQGKGVFSSVFLTEDTETKEKRSVKIIRNNDVMRSTGLRELQILRGLSKKDPDGEKHCVRFYGHFEHRGHLCIVFEALSLNLRQLLKKSKSSGLPLAVVRSYTAQLLAALTFLRRGELVHADVKPDNVLVNTPRTKLYLCDFGSAFDTKTVSLTPYLCSRYYRPPEIILGCEYDFAVDMWSLGCVVFELYSGQILFKGETNNAMLLLFTELLGRIPAKLVKKAAFADDHFGQDGFLLCRKVDLVTGAEYRKPISTSKPNKNLLELLHKERETPFAKLPDSEKKEVRHLKDFIEKCLKIDPAKRMTPFSGLQHHFIKE